MMRGDARKALQADEIRTDGYTDHEREINALKARIEGLKIRLAAKEEIIQTLEQRLNTR